MINDAVAEVFEKDTSGTGAIGSGYTYSGHPVGAAAAIACLKETERLKVNENAAARGAQLFKGAQELMAKHELIGDVRGGHGLMTALELTSDRVTKAMPSKDVAGKIFQAAYDAEVMVRVSGPNIILSPPLILTSDEADKIIAALDHAFTENPLKPSSH